MQVHIILGLGYFGSEAFNNPLISGVMADVAASANDPIFLNHHAMVDCIFEKWLQKNPNVQYPISSEIPKGHRYDDYIVPFFPLYKHRDMFSTADKFGYKCRVDTEPVPDHTNTHVQCPKGCQVLVAMSVIGAIGISMYIVSV